MVDKHFRVIKPEIRVLGIDDGVHTPRVKSLVPLVGVVFRGGCWIDGVMTTHVLVDGFDSTDAIAKMVTASPHYRQLRVIMLSGITFAGFNIVNIDALNKATNLPVIAVTRDKPNMEKVKQAIQNLEKPQERLDMISCAGELSLISLNNKKGHLYIQTAGIQKEDAQKIINLTATRSNIPEPLRVAHLIASAI